MGPVKSEIAGKTSAQQALYLYGMSQLNACCIFDSQAGKIWERVAREPGSLKPVMLSPDLKYKIYAIYMQGNVLQL